ncbi:hypothetical protein VTH82DRAFT_8389 [Thermothelomyces myriococcoides]
MARSAASKLARVARRGLQSTHSAPAVLPRISAAPSLLHYTPKAAGSLTARRFISHSSGLNGITPDNKPAKPVDTPPVPKTPANISINEYHTLADEYLERLLTRLEELQDEREDVEVEYSAGVLNLSLGPDVGTYVINKQPPNKQIWLSSPKTGPKRYDYVVFGEGQDEKQDTATGDWVYLRDGTTLNELLKNEIGVDLSLP